MKSSWQILTILLAVVLVALSIQITKMQSVISSGISYEDKEQIILESIMSRSSVRSYTDQPVEQDKVEVMLKAGMAAPTGGNRQPWELVVITDRNILDAIPVAVKAAGMASKAQLAIAVCGKPSQAFLPGYWIQDCSAVTENILLAAHAMGLGAVWCGVYPENGTGRVASIKSLLALPSGVLPLSIIVIGYPDSEPTIKDKWDPSKVHYNQFHVPYRPVVVKKEEPKEEEPKEVKPLRVVSSADLSKDVFGYAGTTPVELYLNGDTIVEVKVLPNGESPEYMDMLYMANFDRNWNGMVISKAITAPVDAISGATFSSKAIIENVRRAAKWTSENPE